MSDPSKAKTAAPAPEPDAATVEAIRRMAQGLKGASLLMTLTPFYVITLLGRVPILLLASWLLVAVSIPLLRYGMVRWFLARELKPRQVLNWARAIAVSAAIDGIVWGLAVKLFWLPDSLPHQLLLLNVVIGISTGITFVASHYPPTQFSFAIPAVGMTVLWLLLQNTPTTYSIAGGFLVFLVILYPVVQQAHRAVVAEIRVGFENVDLVKQLREQKQEAEQANVAKSKFLAAASHDLRQPLHALVLFATALDEQTRADPQAHGLVVNVNRSIAALEGLFDALLDISRLDAGIVKPNLASLRLAPLMQRLSDEYAPQAKLKKLHWTCDCDDVVVRSDPVLFETILRNLISNAIAYTSKGDIRVECNTQADRVNCQVSDTGIGIPAEHQDEVFGEFVQLHNPERDRTKGLGLGLAIVRRLTDLLGHSIEMQSRPGEGTVFRLSLPLDPNPEPEPDQVAGQEAMGWAAATGKVLVVDDEEMVRDAMRTLLTGWGFEVVAASSVEEALLVAPSKVDAIIADYRLRDEKTGGEAILQLYEAWGGTVPALIITGDTSPDRLLEAKGSGFAFLHKPVEPARLRAFLRSALRKRT